MLCPLMHIIVTGLSHKTAPLKLREKLSLTETQQAIFLKATREPHPTESIHECVLVTTCNRLEVYAVVDSPPQGTKRIIQLLSRISQIPGQIFCPHLYHWQNEQAVEHLVRVAAGLDSMVLGEAQILGQLVAAHQTALSHRTVKATLGRLFQVAIHIGKRVRTETAIGRNPVSISSVAVQLAQHHLADLSQQTVMVLGTGEMGGLTLQALLKQGVKQILVLSRSRERAQKVAATWQMAAPTTEIQPLTLADLPQALPEADLIITSTGATHPVLTRALVAQAMAVRPERSLLIIDISLPRDVEASVGNLPQVHLYNLDDLENQISHGLKERAREIPLAEAIIDQEIETFLAWYRARAVVPIITRFRDQIEDIKEEELNRILKRMKHLDQDDQALVIELAHRLANKFMHQPTVSLKAEAAQGNGAAAVDALQKLFALEVDHPQ